MKKLLTFFMTALLAIGVGWAETSTLTFTKACGGSGTADDGTVWTVTSDAAESSFDNTKGIHYGTSKASVSYLTLSTSNISGTIKSITVNASGASSTSAKLDVSVGGSAFGSQVRLTSTATNYTFSGSASGEIEVILT
ncbi:MAG: chitobiase, partial [Muribaculaceae bacterium]|nr:chitobiase [Muribaculaceae bacterium]